MIGEGEFSAFLCTKFHRPPFDHPEDGPTVPPLFPGEELVVMFKQEPMDTTPFHMMPAELAAEALPEARYPIAFTKRVIVLKNIFFPSPRP